MDRLGPTVPLVLILRLPGQRRPGWLLTFHLACRVVRPDHTTDGLNGTAEPLLALPQGLLRPAALRNFALGRLVEACVIDRDGCLCRNASQQKLVLFGED